MGAKVKWRASRNAWYLYVYANGSQAAQRYGPSPADKRRAERDAKEIERQQRRGRLGLKTPEKRVLFSEFAAQWLEDRIVGPAKRGAEGAVAPKTARVYEQMVRLHLLAYLGKSDLKSLDAASISQLEAHYGRIGKPRSQRSIRIALGILRQILAHARSLGIVEKNAVDDWKAINGARGRKRASTQSKRIAEGKVLSAAERERLLEAFRDGVPHYFPFVLWLAETGCRISEAQSLRWGDVDLSLGLARVQRHKTGEADDIELSDTLVATLRPLRPDISPGDLSAFRTPGGAPIRYENFLHRVWNPVVVELYGRGRRVTPHCLRHTWASLHLARGTPIEWVRRMGGWSSAKMLLDVYGHFIPSEMSGFSNALGSDDRTRPNQTPGGRWGGIASGL